MNTNDVYVDLTNLTHIGALNRYVGNPSITETYINEGITQVVFSLFDGSLKVKVKRNEYFESIDSLYNINNIKTIKTILDII